MAKSVPQIVEEQIRAWSRHNTQPASSKKEPEVYPAITISREFGSPGAALAEYLGDKTGFDVWDKKLLQRISEELGSDQKMIETLDERRKEAIEDTVASYLSNVHTNVKYLHSLIRVVRTIEEHGRGIIVGRGANFICENKKSVHIRLVAPLRDRIADYAKRSGMNKQEVERMTEEKDRERTEFIRRNFQEDVNNPLSYDLVINSSSYSLEQIAEIVLKAYSIKTGVEKEKILSKQ